MSVTQPTEEYQRYCPGEEDIRISDAVCFGRRRVNYPKCKGCQFNDDEQAARSRQRVLAHGLLIQDKQPSIMDAIFKAYDIRGIYKEQLDEDTAWRIGFGCGTYLRSALRGVDRGEAEMNRVVVGRDMRRSSPTMCAALIEGIRASGAGVIDIGMIDTPQLYFGVNQFRCCGGVQTTASHNPAQYIGFKICGSEGKPVGGDTGLNEIRMITQNTTPHEAEHIGELQTEDLRDAYRQFVLQHLNLKRPLKVAVDASNGMAGRVLPIVFDGVDNLAIDPLNFEHDGSFVHDPNPLVPANLASLRERVGKIKADLGVCFDGDADRCMLVDELGEIITCDLVTALLARYFLQRYPGATIVYDLRSSRIVPETIQQAGGMPSRSRVGHAFMKKELAESRAVFGGELSGHFYFQDNWNCDSGLLAFVEVLNVLSAGAAPISELIRPYRRYAASGEINFINQDKDGTIRSLARQYDDAKIDFLDGVTIQYDQWWCNVRKSNTEPLLRLNLEADTPDLLESKVAEIAQLLGERVDH